MSLTATADLSKQLTLYEGTGEVDFDEVMIPLRSFCRAQPTKNILWDLRNADVRLSSRKRNLLTSFLSKLGSVHSGGKIAIIVSPRQGISLTIVLKALPNQKERLCNARTFSSFRQALEWLETGNGHR